MLTWRESSGSQGRLGMTQIFDDTGRQRARDRDRGGALPGGAGEDASDGRLHGRAARLRQREGREARIEGREQATLRRQGRSTRAARRCAEFALSTTMPSAYRGRSDRLTVDGSSQPGEHGQGDGHDKGPRLPGRREAPRLRRRAGSHGDTKHRTPGSIGAGHQPVARDQGQAHARPHGR